MFVPPPPKPKNLGVPLENRKTPRLVGADMSKCYAKISKLFFYFFFLRLTIPNVYLRERKRERNDFQYHAGSFGLHRR